MKNRIIEAAYKLAVAALGASVVFLGLIAINVALVKCIVKMISG